MRLVVRSFKLLRYAVGRCLVRIQDLKFAICNLSTGKLLWEEVDALLSISRSSI